MITLLKLIKLRMPFIWRWLERCNGVAVQLRFGMRIKDSVIKSLQAYDNVGYKFRQIEKEDLSKVVTLLSMQPADFDKYFKPHAFDLKTLIRLHKSNAFVMLGAFDDDKIMGYFFIRFFANGKAFRGKMVDYNYQGQGIAKMMGEIMTDIALNAGFRLFATIAKENRSSIASSKAVNEIKVIKELDDNYLYVEYLPKKN